MALADSRTLAAPRPRQDRRPPGLLATIWRRRTDYIYVAPAILVMLVVIGYPLVSTVVLSFYEITPRNEQVFTGLENYQRIFSDRRINFWTVTPTVEGNFQGRCAELCGLAHSRMLFEVNVVSEEEYQAHLADLAAQGNTGIATGAGEASGEVAGLDTDTEEGGP